MTDQVALAASPDSKLGGMVTAHPAKSGTNALAFLILLLWVPAFAQGPSLQSGLGDATALLKAGKLAEARDAFESLLRINPSNLPAQEGVVAASERLALDARAAGDFDGALRELLRARGFSPENVRLLYDLGVLEDEMSLFNDADATLAAAEKFSPGDPRVWYASARVKLDLAQLGPAEEKMKAYLKVKPDDASAHYGLGRVYQLGLHFDAARAEFHKSIELHPAQTEAYYQLGDMALEEGDLAEAMSAFGKTLSRDPKHGGALAGTGAVYFRWKQYEKAAEYLRQAILAAPVYQPAHYYLGLTLGRLGRSEESRRELDTAAKLAEVDNDKASHRKQLNVPTNPE